MQPVDAEAAAGDLTVGAAEAAITAGTRLIALLGNPVAHSLSPRFQNAAFRAAGVGGFYLALRCAATDLPGLLRGIAHSGGGGNITVPHKEAAAALIDHATEAVLRTGACNTFWLEGGRICGDNTDVAGFRMAVHDLIGSPASARVLLLGAGGAARAALLALLDEGAESVHLLNRTPARAEALRAAFDDHDRARHRIAIAPTLAALHNEHFDLVVNSTSLGIHPEDPSPLPLDAGGVRIGAALDLVYAPGETRWVREARERGIPSADGIEMLLHQGAAAFERWWQRPAPLEAMRAALS
jgi:shikimate dehydrogenase